MGFFRIKNNCRKESGQTHTFSRFEFNSKYFFKFEKEVIYSLNYQHFIPSGDWLGCFKHQVSSGLTTVVIHTRHFVPGYYCLTLSVSIIQYCELLQNKPRMWFNNYNRG